MYDAWQESKRRCYEWLERQRVHLTSMWFRALWEEERSIAGPDIYPWGYKRTRSEVDKMLQYSYQQGLTASRLEPEDLFHASTLVT
jgi:4,5-dihydroxyphthalate decarboxylase